MGRLPLGPRSFLRNAADDIGNRDEVRCKNSMARLYVDNLSANASRHGPEHGLSGAPLCHDRQ